MIKKKLNKCCRTCFHYHNYLDDGEDPEDRLATDPCIVCSRNPDLEDKYEEQKCLLEV